MPPMSSASPRPHAASIRLLGIALLALPGRLAAADPEPVPERLLEGPAWPIARGPLRVHRSGRFLEHRDGTPFLYLGDTAWELLHRLTREETERYLENRRARGFTVIQTVALSELDGLRTPNAYGHFPLRDDDPRRPDVRSGPDNDYWDHVDWVFRRAAEKGLYLGFLPTWGDKVVRLQWGKGPEVFDAAKALAYGRFLGRRYRGTPNLIWILGGDRPAVHDESGRDDRPIWRAMARGLREGDGGSHLITYHPYGGRSSSDWLHAEPWLAFNMTQSGHARRDDENYDFVMADYLLTPAKPVLDGEPRYENIPVAFDPRNGHFDAYDVRQAAYWAVLSGGFGHTYGCHEVWQMWAPGREPMLEPRIPWFEAIELPGARQMLALRRLLLSRPFTGRVPDPRLLKRRHQGTGADHVAATRARDGSHAILYLPTGKPVEINLGQLGLRGGGTRTIRATWFDPRTGVATHLEDIVVTKRYQDHTFTPPGSPGRGNDWVLLLDDEAAGLPAPRGD